ncbi:MAG: PEGA domain-containing protein [Deltaproteobacteria bacterium]|nr:PEGA domain-containing protein [Deltaproteobacteria bacterium]
MGRLRLQVTPPVTVLLGERELGTTPFMVDISAGVHELRLMEPKLGIQLKRRGWIKAADLTVLRWDLKGKLVIKCHVLAQIRVDGQRRGTAPEELELLAGRHTVELIHGGQRLLRQRIKVRAGKTSRVQCPVAPSPTPTEPGADDPGLSLR